MSSYRTIFSDGLWNNNAALVQLLGLCPLLAVTSTVVNGFGMGVATTLVLLISNVTISMIRDWVKPEIRIPVFVLVIASAVTTIELLIQALFYELYLVLGIFIPLIVTNCTIIGRAEAFASRNGLLPSIADALSIGAGFTIVLMLLGGMREIIGFGTLWQQAGLMFGDAAEWMTITLVEDYSGMLIAVLPPGAFLGLGFLIALKNVIDRRREHKEAAAGHGVMSAHSA